VEGCFGRQRQNTVGNLAVCSADTALKEAIRRSLHDVKPKTEEKEKLKDKKTFMKEDDITVESREQENDIRLSENEEEKVEAIIDDKDEVEVEVIIDDNNKANIKDITDENGGVQVEAEAIAEENDEDEDEEEVLSGEDENGGVKVEVEASVEEKYEDEEEALAVEDENNNNMENMKIANTEDNENASRAEEVSLFTTELKIAGEIDKEESLAKSSIDSSFAEDAEGQGDVAIAIGMALDITANAIDAVVSEIEKPVDYTTGEFQTQVGHTILGSVNTANSDDMLEESSQTHSFVSSNEEWQVLHEDGQDTSDETIAQATQLLGSALFESDIISDVTEILQSVTYEPSYVDSIPTHVPTIMSKEISSVVLSRWDTELKQMHELGFLDEEVNVNALEHLQAVNMSVDSDEPVTVNEAVNYLFSN